MDNKEREEILELFKQELEKNYERGSDEYHKGIAYYFELRQCQTIDELNYMYEMFSNELFRYNDFKNNKR